MGLTHMIRYAVFSLLMLAVAAAVSTSDMRSTIQRLLTALHKERVPETVAFRPIPPRWAEMKGLYKSYVHINTVGGEAMDLFRREFAVPDSNMFVTSFVLTALLEAHQLGTIDLTPYQSELADSLATVALFRDKNRPPSVPSYVFWPQTLVNGTWSAGSMNLVDPLAYLGKVDEFVEAVFKLMHLEELLADAELVQMVVAIFTQAFRIPPDTDDSSVNLALGGTLRLLAGQFPTLYANWEAHNTDIASLFALETQYSYKPLGGNGSTAMTDLIDPRTYFVLSAYLDQLNAQGELNGTAFPTTWLLDIPAEVPIWMEEAMPFNTDNVDLCVVANFLYGSSHAVVQGLNNGRARAFFESNTEFQNLYLSAAKLLSWGIMSGTVAARPDISLLYYPSLYDFMWMVSRTAFLLNQNAASLPPQMSQALQLLGDAMQSAGTAKLLELAQSDAKHGTYWDDFLGDAEKPPQGEDRLFSTALAVNTFISTWAQPTANSKCPMQWSASTPASVKSAVQSAAAFLNNQTLDGSLKLLPMNAFFSGSMKVNSCLPFSYPGNYNRFLNGTWFDPHNAANGVAEAVWGVEGYVPPVQYKAMLSQTWFNMSVPMEFDGFNSNGGWPFWSSPSMTYSLSLLALSQYVIIDECSS
eukprot:TRINITY_DN7514_c0_g1_i2.p1 TRINITY_DN7514_c0_g1~~TRINITY_DN7514_c0_g1_i2.p1  ORF type:complete len:640 (+),score=224.14 TRINITY_DN7514_c0_g1_i2:132-2051(+)